MPFDQGTHAMTQPDFLHDNRPLACSARWFLIGACLVLGLAGAVLTAPPLTESLLKHPVLIQLSVGVLTLLFVVLGATAAVLGFLSGCRPGRAIGFLSIVVTCVGLVSAAWLYWSLLHGVSP